MLQQETQFVEALNEMTRQLRQDYLYLLIHNVRPMYQTPEEINARCRFAFPQATVFALLLHASSKRTGTPVAAQWLTAAEQHLRARLSQLPGDAETLIVSDSNLYCMLGTTLPYSEVYEKLCDIFQELQALPGMYTCAWTMGIGRCVSSIAALRESLVSAQHALKYCVTEGTEKIYDGNAQYGIFEGGLTLLQSADELALKQAILSLRTDEVEACIHSLFDRRMAQIKSYPVYAFMLSLQILQVSLQALRERMPIDRKTYELEQTYESVIDAQATLDALIQQTVTGSLRLCGRYRQFTEQGHSRPIWLAVTYIQEHYTQRIPLDALAAHADRNPQYLSASFTKELGMSITDYIASLRIERAKELLLSTDTTVSEIGAQVGYDDPRYFSRIFQKSTGESPRAYRTRHRLE